jgi:hypothetical protein
MPHRTYLHLPETYLPKTYKGRVNWYVSQYLQSMTAEYARKGHYNPRAFFPNETYCVWESESGYPVQSDATAETAERSCGILNNHEIKNGRPGNYRWFKFAAPCQNS